MSSIFKGERLVYENKDHTIQQIWGSEKFWNFQNFKNFQKNVLKNIFVNKMYSIINENAISDIKNIFGDR